MTTALIDADALAYRIASATETRVDWEGDGIVSTSTDFKAARGILGSQIRGIMGAVEADSVVLCWSCPTRRYFRHDIYPAYKGNRTGTVPGHLRRLREWAERTYPSKSRPRLEGDDVLGILGTNPRLIVGERVIVSPDKDLLQVPGLHFNPNRRDDGVFRIDGLTATRNLWTQVLTGDSVDGYPGCPGIGPVKAARILEGPPSAFEDAVETAFIERGGTRADMLTQYNIARILQTSTYNFKTQEPILYG